MSIYTEHGDLFVKAFVDKTKRPANFTCPYCGADKFKIQIQPDRRLIAMCQYHMCKRLFLIVPREGVELYGVRKRIAGLINKAKRSSRGPLSNMVQIENND